MQRSSPAPGGSARSRLRSAKNSWSAAAGPQAAAGSAASGPGNRSSGSGQAAASAGSARASRAWVASRASASPQRWPTAANGTAFLVRLRVISYGWPARSSQLTGSTDSTEPSTHRS